MEKSAKGIQCILSWLQSYPFNKARDLRQRCFPISTFSSVQFSHSVMPDSLWPHRLQHARLPCPSPTLGAHSKSCPLSQWCHPTISYSVIPFSSCLQSCPASESFPVSQLFALGGQSIGTSASANSPSNKYSALISFKIDWFDLLAVQGTLKNLLQNNLKASLVN